MYKGENYYVIWCSRKHNFKGDHWIIFRLSYLKVCKLN